MAFNCMLQSNKGLRINGRSCSQRKDKNLTEAGRKRETGFFYSCFQIMFIMEFIMDQLI